mmetsp:Transcript_22539/g.53251  ORF Transcript_22539/g.53251 Transcript_22539/m.53251 type:complete len:200 (-) Transcript_22539:336-935(-)
MMKSVSTILFVAMMMLLGVSMTSMTSSMSSSIVVMAQEEAVECNCDDVCESKVSAVLHDAEMSKEQMMNTINDLQAKLEAAVQEKVNLEEQARYAQGELQGQLDTLKETLQQTNLAAEAQKQLNDQLTAQKSDLEAKMSSLQSDAEEKVSSIKAELEEKASKLEQFLNARFYVNFDMLKSDIMGLISKVKKALGMEDEL